MVLGTVIFRKIELQPVEDGRGRTIAVTPEWLWFTPFGPATRTEAVPSHTGAPEGSAPRPQVQISINHVKDTFTDAETHYSCRRR